MSDMAYKSDDLLKTSSGIGHYWRRDQPDSEVAVRRCFVNSCSITSIMINTVVTKLICHFQLFQTKLLPEVLKKSPKVASGDHYQTTSRTIHNYKCSLQNYGSGTSFIKPPAHYKVHYNKDLHDKVVFSLYMILLYFLFKMD